MPFEKDEEYYGSERPEVRVFMRIPGPGMRILDVGCGSGGLGAGIKRITEAHITGVEIVESAAARAREVLDEVHLADVETFPFDFEEASFDYVIFADVLEHLRDPWALLSRIRRLVKPGGQVVASIPNIRHRVIIGQLLRGKFEYDKHGIMDITHLRFFTYESLVRMFVEAKLRPTEIFPMADENTAEIVEYWKNAGVRETIGRLTTLLIGQEFIPEEYELPDFLTIQFLVRCAVSAT